MLRNTAALAALMALCTGGPAMADELPGYDRVAGMQHASRSEVIAPHGMAATSQPLATRLGSSCRYHLIEGADHRLAEQVDWILEDIDRPI